MIREIDLREYLPPFLVEYRELKRILETENIFLQQVENENWQIVDNRFITSCDEYGISRYERMMNITPLDDDTLDDRRFRILSNWNKVLPYNFAFLYNQLVTLCGEDNFSMTIENMVLTIKLGLTSKRQTNAVQELCDTIVPCAVLVIIGLLYNTHETLSHYTHADLMHYNHRQLREEPLDVHHNEYGDFIGLTHGELSAYTHYQLFRNEL